MSTKTAIDLDTLGSPDNDSEGANCYISEKGIQALPCKKNIIGEYGAYLCKFFMCGVAYYVFSNQIIDENGNPVKAMYMEFDNNGMLSNENDKLMDAPPEFYFNKQAKFERDIKTVSYMTLTKGELNLYDISKNETLNFIAESNILAVFSCSIIAFQHKDDHNLIFVKNPVFHYSTTDDVSDISPLQVYIYRAFIPLPSNVGFTAEECGKHTYQGFTDGRLVLHEESIFLYDKDSRKIKALYQRRRRLKGDAYLDGKLTFNDRYPEMYVLGSSFGIGGGFVYTFYYVHAFYFFTEINYGLNVQRSTLRTNFFRTWDGNYESGSSIPVLDISEYPYFPRCIPMQNGTALFHLNPDMNKKQSQDFAINWGSGRLQWAPSDYLKVDKDTTIDEVMEFADHYTLYPTPDDGYNAEWRCWNFITQESANPSLFASLGQAHYQEYLWAQRSRLFSLGTKSFKNVWPFNDIANQLETIVANKEELELRRFASVQMRGNEENNVMDIRINEEYLGKFSDLSNILWDNGVLVSRLIYSLFKWPKKEVEIENVNEVYFTMIGSLGYKFEDLPYFVPSNISDIVVGLYGIDRNIFTISKKSIEQFNIADLDVNPVQFVSLKGTYDILVDWSGLNDKLDILAKERGQYIFNNTPRVKKCFNMDSRILPATTSKGVALDIVQISENEIRIIDPNKREFLIPISAPIHAITLKGRDDIFCSAQGQLWETAIDDGNSDRFKVSWTYRTGRNILLSKILIRTAQYDAKYGSTSRIYRVFKDNEPIRERDTKNQTVEFYKIGRGLNNRLTLEMEGYLREVEIEDTERGQK